MSDPNRPPRQSAGGDWTSWPSGESDPEESTPDQSSRPPADPPQRRQPPPQRPAQADPARRQPPPRRDQYAQPNQPNQPARPPAEPAPHRPPPPPPPPPPPAPTPSEGRGQWADEGLGQWAQTPARSQPTEPRPPERVDPRHWEAAAPRQWEETITRGWSEPGQRGWADWGTWDDTMTGTFAPIREPLAPTDPRTGSTWDAPAAPAPEQERVRTTWDEPVEEKRAPAPPSYETGRTGKAAVVMASGTVLSRLTGFMRIALLAAVVGSEGRNDLFTVANTIPNSLYILLAGGIFNTVLVPQLVRAIKHHRDGGQEYTDRLMTAGLLVLAVVTTICVLIAPLIAHLYIPQSMNTPAHAEQRANIEFFTRLCLPQIFFYGAYVLVGQILNARQRFGPMMWAPIANNVVAIGTILLFWSLYGAHSQPESYTDQESLLLGLGHTAGIAVQLLVLLPYLRASGYHYRPRFGLRDTGLGRTAQLGMWTVLFVAVNQVTLIIITRLALNGTSGAGAEKSAGVFAYSTSMLMFLVPHGIVTVSLATAILPRLSAQASDGNLEAVARDAAATTRQALAVVVPAAIGMFAFAFPLMSLVAEYGAAKGRTGLMSLTLMALALGLLPFTVQYMQLRTFYAFEDTKTPFFIQCGIAAVNIAAALFGVHVLLSSPRLSAIALGAAYTLAYLIGVFVSRAVLRRRLPRVEGAEVLGPALSMVIAATIAAGCGVVLVFALNVLTEGSGPVYSAFLLIVAGAVMLPLYAWLARALRIDEVNDLVRTIMSRLPGRA